MKFMFLSLSFLVFTACANELNKKPSAPAVVVPLTKDSVVYTVEATSDFNKYKVSFKWPATNSRFEILSAGVKKFSANPSQSDYEEVVDGGKTYEYSFDNLDDSSAKDSLVFVVEVPLDYQFKGIMNFSGDTVIVANRLFINGDAQVSSFRNRLVINANEIYSEGGIIQNYPWEFQDCQDHRNGNKGGDIAIVGRKAQGALNISMVGARGCVGGSGGAGGRLAVMIENGGSLLLNTQIRSALGSPRLPNWLVGPLGQPGTSCISLSKDQKETCAIN